MPGTPPVSPVHGVPRVSNADTFDQARDLNAVVDRFDITAMRLDTGLASARPGTGPGTGAWYYATDTRQLSRWSGSAWETNLPNAHAASHQDGGTDALTVREAMMDTGATGLAKGSFSAFRSTSISLATGAVVPFNIEEFDLSNWYDSTTANAGRYTPLVAGYYQIDWAIGSNALLTADVHWRSFLNKNATAVKAGSVAYQRGATIPPVTVGSAVVQANGTTDFFTVTIDHGTGGSAAILNSSVYTFFQGHLIGRS